MISLLECIGQWEQTVTEQGIMSVPSIMNTKWGLPHEHINR